MREGKSEVLQGTLDLMEHWERVAGVMDQVLKLERQG